MIKIIRNGYELGYESFVFPGGEVSVKLDFNKHKTSYYANTRFFTENAESPVIFLASLKSSGDVMKLALLVDAVRELVTHKAEFWLYIPYIPYGRQDRVCDMGEAFSLRAFCKIIESLGFKRYMTYDPHSDITKAFLDRDHKLETIDQVSILDMFSNFRNDYFKLKNPVFVSPDAGANKKTVGVAKYFGSAEFVRADKLRDLSTGKILETIVYKDDFKGADVVVCDDICDGGRTFIELAKACKAKNCGKFILYVTHGIFSKGVDELFNNGIDGIYTTNSFYEGSDPRVKVLDIFGIFLEKLEKGTV